MIENDAKVWLVLALLAVGTYLIRLSFLGLVGNRRLPDWLARTLRFTPVAVLPALVAPLILWPEATGGTFDPVRGAAAATTVGVGLVTRNTVLAIVCGGVVLFGGLWLIPQ
ncbi:Branched-chain amino acid transport protein [Tranquillimonas rosea]|uniref:Branched-chain amino acid transport protein n=1 Tax=Tranquillimonas rosea TaxID=641238 RepID=A0A1H9R4G4_9RHOB|nr:AzlD domain-containing protein [Tranquillimonas rosea]SER67590.1 Branched-chain amino acid transport protein [Tranquillimonas rosea]